MSERGNRRRERGGCEYRRSTDRRSRWAHQRRGEWWELRGELARKGNVADLPDQLVGASGLLSMLAGKISRFMFWLPTAASERHDSDPTAMQIYTSEVEIPRPVHLGADQWSLNELTPITVLFGKNSSGKSLLLRAWRDEDPENTHYVTPERGGEINYEPGQITDQQNPEGRRRQTANNFVPNYRQQVVARVTAYFAMRGDYRGEGKFPVDPSEIEQLIGLLIPDFTVTISSKTTPPFDITRVGETERIENVQQLSSGEAQIITLGLDVLTIAAMWDIEERATRLLFVDEPDAHLHPDLQARLADFLCRVAERFSVQIVVATHSTTLLAALGQFGDNDASVI